MRIVFFLLLITFVRIAEAQEKLMPVMTLEKDSAQVELERQLLYRDLLSGTIQSGGLIDDLEIPPFDIYSALARQRYNFDLKENLNSGEPEIFTYNQVGFYPSPFFRNGVIFSGASYKLNDKFKLGGYSFGANSIFSAPLPNQGMNNFDTRGATMFMEYKVSKKFKIETRVSVTQGKGPGF